MSYAKTSSKIDEEKLLKSALPHEDAGVEVEFDAKSGYNYLCIVPSVFLPCCAPFFSLLARKNMEAQKCEITDRRVVFESGWLNHSHKSIPLDRIQDVNVRQDCIQACFDVKSIEIQTAGAGGGIEPEALLVAPVDAMMVRDAIMDRRDALVLGHPGLLAAGTAPSKADPSMAVLVEELRSIRATLGHLAKNVETGVEQLQLKN
jgi:membrane protein YdbS with pleckstrin-like domain